MVIRNRPHTKEKSLNYGQIIENELNQNKQERLVLVNNLAFGRATMRDLDKFITLMERTFLKLEMRLWRKKY